MLSGPSNALVRSRAKATQVLLPPSRKSQARRAAGRRRGPASRAQNASRAPASWLAPTTCSQIPRNSLDPWLSGRHPWHLHQGTLFWLVSKRNFIFEASNMQLGWDLSRNSRSQLWASQRLQAAAPQHGGARHEEQGVPCPRKAENENLYYDHDLTCL